MWRQVSIPRKGGGVQCALGDHFDVSKPKMCSKRQPKDLGWANAWVLGVALLLAVPFAAAQTVAAWMTVLVRGRDWERRMDAGRFMLASFVVGTPELCDNSNSQTCVSPPPPLPPPPHPPHPLCRSHQCSPPPPQYKAYTGLVGLMSEHLCWGLSQGFGLLHLYLTLGRSGVTTQTARQEFAAPTFSPSRP